MANRIQLRRGTAAEWASANPVLAQGEPGVETDTGKQKFGNGVDVWSALPYASAGPQGPAGVADDASVAAIIEDTGSETAGVLSATIATAIAATPSGSPIAELATIGDSITAGGQGGGIYWSQLVSDYLGLSVWNPSVPGESPADIATRQGGLAPELTLTDDIIPADTTPAIITAITPSAGWRTGAGAGFEKIGTFTGRLCGIPGTLVHSQINGSWTFTRTTAGTATACPAGSKFYTQDGKYNRAVAACAVTRLMYFALSPTVPP